MSRKRSNYTNAIWSGAPPPFEMVDNSCDGPCPDYVTQYCANIGKCIGVHIPECESFLWKAMKKGTVSTLLAAQYPLIKIGCSKGELINETEDSIPVAISKLCEQFSMCESAPNPMSPTTCETLLAQTISSGGGNASLVTMLDSLNAGAGCGSYNKTSSDIVKSAYSVAPAYSKMPCVKNS